MGKPETSVSLLVSNTMTEMPTRELFRTEIVALLAGMVLLWSIPVWLRLAEGYPRNYEDLEAVSFWFSLSLAGAGGWLLGRDGIRMLPKRWEPDRCPRIFPDITLRSVLPWHRHRLTPFISQLPNFGLMCGAVLWILVFLFMIFRETSHPYGLPIKLRTYDSVVWTKSPWQETLSVYLAVGERYYINGQAVPREDLSARLRQELGRRAVWTVYFEADFDTLNMDAIYAMDTIQGLGGNLVWITPKVREELQHQGQPRGSHSRETAKRR
jgi:biopolymer transport protein ExbD